MLKPVYLSGRKARGLRHGHAGQEHHRNCQKEGGQGERGYQTFPGLFIALINQIIANEKCVIF